MAKKDEFDLGKDDLDDLNFDDLNFDDMDFGEDSMKDSRKPVEHFKDTFKTNVKSKLTDPGFIKRMIKKVVGKGYVQAFDAYDALDSTIADIMKDNASELSPYLIKSKQKMDRMNPTLRRMIPGSIRDAVDSAEEPYRHDEGPDELTQNIDGIDKLLGFEAKKQMQGEYKDAVRDVREKKRFTAEMKVSTATAKGIGRLVGYQDTVLVNYHRKNIEIGYRQLDVGIRTLKLHQQHYHTSELLLKDILKNTGLPDFLKMKTTELVEQQLKQRLAGAAMEGVAGSAKKFFGGLKQNASDMLGQGLQFNQSLNEGSDMGVNRAQMAGSILGSLAADWVGDKAEDAGNWAAKKLKPKLNNAPGVAAGDNILRQLFGGIFQRINDYAKSDTDYDNKYWALHEGAKGLIDTHNTTRTVQGNGIMDLDKPAQFDNIFHKSVVEIIPAHLASIDRWVKTMATGETQEETAFSHYTGSLVSRSTLKNQHLNLTLKGNLPNVRGMVDEILGEMGAGELSGEARRALRMQLTADLQEGMDFKPERYVEKNTWDKADPSVVNELLDFFHDKFKLDKETKQHNGDQDNLSFHNDVRDKFIDVSNNLPDFGRALSELTSGTGRRAWRDLGLTKYNGNQSDAIQMQELYKVLLAGEETDIVKKEEKKETAKEKLQRMKAEEEKRQLREQGSVDLENDDDLRGAFDDGPTKGPRPPRKSSSSNRPKKNRPDLVPPVQQVQANVVMPESIKAIVEFPELFKASDEETHKRLDLMLGMADQANKFLDYLAHKASGAMGAGDAPGDGGEGPEGDPQKKRWRDYSIGNAAGHGLKATKVAGKGVLGYIKGTYSAMWKVGKFGAKTGFAAAKLPFKNISGLGVSDVHVMGDEEPSLLAKGIKKGWYFDVATQKTIMSIKDITGEVKDREGNVVLTTEEFEKGLYNGKGESLAGYGLKLGAKAGGIAARLGAAYIGGTYGLIWKGIKMVSNFAVNQFTQFDAYFPGDTEPRIRSNLMKKGKYRNADGSPIFSLKEIKGPVFEMNEKGDMNEIVSQDEIDKYKSFYTRNGSLLFTIGKGFAQVGVKAAQLAAKAALAYGKFAIKMYKGIAKGVGKVIGGTYKFVAGRFGKNGGIGMLDEEMAAASIEIGVEQLKVQGQIFNLLKAKLDPEGVHGDVDGDGDRDNSWADILKRRKEEKEGKMGGAKDAGSAAIVDAIKTMNKDMDKKFDDLAEVTEEAGESSLLEDAADLADLGGGEGGDGKRGRKGRPKKGFRSGRGIRGKIGNGVSKIGRGLKKIPGAGSLGRAAGWVGRGAIAAAGMLPSMATLGAGASAVGGALMTGATAVGGALATAGSAVVGVLGMPLILGAVAVGGIAYLGYRYYKSSQAKKFPLLYLRMTQYGVAPTDEDRVKKMLALESLCKGAVTVTRDGKASMDPKSIDPDAFLKLFPTSGPEEQHNLLSWVATRFRPVFLAHCTAMQSIRGTTDLVSADEGIGNGDLSAYLQIVDLANMQKVYDDTDTSPFDSDLDCDADDVEDAIKMVRDRKEQKAENKAAAVAGGIAIGSAAQVAKNTTLGVAANGQAPNDIAKGLVIAPGVVGGFGAAAQVGNKVASQAKKNLDIPTAVRFKTYGLKEMSLDKAQQLQAVEDIYWEAVQYSGTDKAMIGGNQDELAQKVMVIFKPADGQAHEDATRWLNYRFIPTFLQYCISSRRRFNGAAKDASRNLTGVLMKEVLQETIQTSTDTMMSKVSVWSITNSPWVGYELETLPGSVTLYLDGIDTGDKSKVLNVDGMETQKRTAGQDYGTKLTNVAMGNTTTNGNRGNVGVTGPTLSNMGKVFSGQQVSGGVAGQAPGGQGTGALLMSGKYGAEVVHPGGGTGGDINKLPNATGKGWGAMGPIITAAAEMVGFDPKIAAAVAGVESGFDPNASSGIAHGLYQFVKGTWSDMITKYGATYGIAPNTPITDPRANAILGMCYLKENYNGLSKTLGGKVTDVDLYAAHFLGLGGARRFLSAPREAPASAHASEAAIKNNASVFKDKSGRMRTVGETIAELDRRVDIGRKKAGQTSTTTQSGIQKDVGATDIGATAAAAAGGASAAGGAPAGGSAPAESGPAEAEGPTSVGGAVEAAGGLTASANAAAAASSSAAGSGSAPSAIPTGSTSAAAIAEIKGGNGAGTGAPAVSTPSPMIPQPTASAAAASSSQQSAMKAQESANVDLSGVMQKLLEVNQDSNTTLHGILAKLDNLGGATPQASAPTPPKAEPARRTPLDNTRANAVT